MPKNLFTTKTVTGSIFSGLTIFYLAFPHAANIIKRRTNMVQSKDIDDVVAIVVTIGGFYGVGRSIGGRHNATKDVYTPDWLPGRSFEDCEK